MTAIKDPVCGMQVAEDSPNHLEHAGQDYHFCSQQCLEKFQADPATYLKPVAAPESRPARVQPDKLTQSVSGLLHLPDAPRGASGQTRLLSQVRYGAGAGESCLASVWGDRVHLSDASRSGERQTRQLPEVWHGAGTAQRPGRRHYRTE